MQRRKGVARLNISEKVVFPAYPRADATGYPDYFLFSRRVPKFAESPLVARVPNGKIQDNLHNHEFLTVT